MSDISDAVCPLIIFLDIVSEHYKQSTLHPMQSAMIQAISTTAYHDSYNIICSIASHFLHANFSRKNDKLDKISEFLLTSLLFSVLEPVATLN